MLTLKSIDTRYVPEEKIPEDEDTGLCNESCNLSERVLALYKNGNFTDITLTFHGTDITYDAHRLILAISSPVFEGILYGPMRTEGRNVLLHGDDPLIVKYVIAHCYGKALDTPDLNIALEVYKLADKYLLEALKIECCEVMVNCLYSDPDKISDIMEFAERYNFTDLKFNCLPLIKDLFDDELHSYGNYDYYTDEPDSINVFAILIGLSDKWIEDILSVVSMNILDFHESWKYPDSPLDDNRLRTILSSIGCNLHRFYGCINAESIHQFPLISSVDEPDPSPKESLQLYLSVTDLNHAKRVIDAINQQNGFENNLIAMHIRCEEVWPINWSPIRPERTQRPSVLLISDADDDRAAWVIEAVKAFLPQCEGSDTKLFIKDDYERVCELNPDNVLFLPRSNFTPDGFINLLKELSSSGVKCDKICIQSAYISDAHWERINGFIHTLVHPFIRLLYLGLEYDNFFRNITDNIPEKA